MSKIKDKYNNWKSNKYTKFRNQTTASYLETEKEAKEVAKIYNNDEKLETFAYEFKKPWHQKGILVAKKINIIISLVLSGLFLILIGFYASLINCNWFDPAGSTPEVIASTNHNAWLANFIYTTIIAGINVIYFIILFILKYFRKKKFEKSPNYIFRFNDNVIVTVILLLYTSTYFISFYPINFLPVLLIQILKYNYGTMYVLLITTFIFEILTFVCFILYLTNVITCFLINPKFNFNLLANSTNKINSNLVNDQKTTV